jgi:hypothetical protein
LPIGSKLKPNGIGSERLARQPRPLDRAPAFLDPLLGRAALIVEGDNPLGRAGQVGDDEADARNKLAGCHSTFAITRRGLVQLPA